MLGIWTTAGEVADSERELPLESDTTCTELEDVLAEMFQEPNKQLPDRPTYNNLSINHFLSLEMLLI